MPELVGTVDVDGVEDVAGADAPEPDEDGVPELVPDAGEFPKSFRTGGEPDPTNFGSTPLVMVPVPELCPESVPVSQRLRESPS